MAFLEINKVSKRFGKVVALNKISFNAEKTQVIAILGENGAGKTTISNVLFGLYQADEGHISIDGKVLNANSPKEALDAGVGMIHQHFNLVDVMTAVENILIGLPKNMRSQDAPQKIVELSNSYGFDIDFEAQIGDMPVGMRQRIEILKALYRDVSILILDEPTSVLTPNEVEEFLEGISKLSAAGKIIFFVTHKLDEVMQVTDRVLVMRHGALVGAYETEQVSAEQLSAAMIGRDIHYNKINKDNVIGDVVLDIANAHAKDDRGLLALKSLSITVKSGEIVGVAGVDGNGQRELSECIAGLRDVEDGSILLNGINITKSSITERQNAGIGFVPEDRHATGLVLTLSVAENMVFRKIDQEPNAQRGLINRGGIFEKARAIAEEFNIHPRDVSLPASALSGGNQQKIVLAREIASATKLLVVVQPTKGLDVGAIEFVQSQMVAAAERGVGVLYISTELEHIIEIADRLAVISSGHITGEILPAEATATRVGLLMAGEEERAA